MRLIGEMYNAALVVATPHLAKSVALLAARLKLLLPTHRWEGCPQTPSWHAWKRGIVSARIHNRAISERKPGG